MGRIVGIACLAFITALACTRTTMYDASADSEIDSNLDASSLDVGQSMDSRVADIDETSAPRDAMDADSVPDAPRPLEPLEVRFLGVQGFALRTGGDMILTAPLFTRASVIDVTIGTTVADEAAIVRGLAGMRLDQLRAVITGHAHYDHLMDVPPILRRVPTSLLYANRTAQHILAALAPDRAARCTTPVPTSPIARERVIALDDPATSAVDYRNCPTMRPAGASLEGRWIRVPGSHVRIRPFCSFHPDQIWVIHFGAGSVDADLCDLPTSAANWLEGATMSYLIDFLDDADRPRFRVYYQDAPTDGPMGHVPADILAEKAVDVALLCAGNYDRVRDQPGEIIAALRPRFAVSGHWEDFFIPITSPIRPLPFLNLMTYTMRGDIALPPPADRPLLRDGAPAPGRNFVAQPGNVFIVPAQ